MMRRAAEITADGAFATDQFNNRDALDGYRVIGEEIGDQLDGAIAAFCAYVGVSGCFVGTTEALRTRHPSMARVVVEPAESAVLSGRAAGTHRIEGGGIGFKPPLLSFEMIDRIETVSTDEAFAMARQAARTEGIFTGPSGGANIVVALRLAAELGSDHRVVTVQPDSGLKYLAGDLIFLRSPRRSLLRFGLDDLVGLAVDPLELILREVAVVELLARQPLGTDRVALVRHRIVPRLLPGVARSGLFG